MRPRMYPNQDVLRVRDCTERELGLPRIRRLRSRKYKAAFYGAMSVLAEYCNVRFYRRDPAICWVHGAGRIDEGKSDKYQILGDELVHHHSQFFVKNDSEVIQLREFGIEAQATGMPIIYTRPPEVERIPNSLLIVPMHSLDFTKYSWNYDLYAEQVSELQESHDFVVACVHPSCWRKGSWVDVLSRRGIPCIRGADSSDRNALRRMAKLFSLFDTMTTNGWGSHLSYASYFGARIAIYGTYAALQREDFEGCEFYDGREDQLALVVEQTSEEFIRSRFPWLFEHPQRAQHAVSWGRDFVGWSYKKSPEEITSMMGWRGMQSLSRFMPGAICKNCNGDDVAVPITKSVRWRYESLFQRVLAR